MNARTWTEPGEPPPRNIYDLVETDLRGREAVGVAEYGSSLSSDTPIDALLYAYEEALDLACYLRKALFERDGK